MKTEWNLDLVLKKPDDKKIAELRTEIEKAYIDFEKKWKGNESYLKDPRAMKKALDEYEKLVRLYGNGGKETYYFWLREKLNQSDKDTKAKFNSAEQFYLNLLQKLRFFTLSIAKLPPAEQQMFLKSALLSNYRHYLEQLFASSKYLLSEKEENLIALKEKFAHSNWEKMVEEFISREEREVTTENGKKEKRTREGLLSLMKSQDPKIRNEAAIAFNDILDKYVDVAEHELNSILGNKKVDDRLRGLSRPDVARHIDDDIDTKVVDVLIDTVKSRFSLSQRFFALKARLLGLKKIKYYERNVDVGKIKGSFDISKSVELIRQTFGELDEEFVNLFDKYLENGQIDFLPRKGKAGGGFCVGWNMPEPTYILLNHNNKLYDVTVLAHELGHGFNNEFMKGKQNALNFGTPKSTAEVASTFMEDFVLQRILKEADEETRFALMIQKLENDISTIFRQTALYSFELELHDMYRKNDHISIEEIGKLFVKHMGSYMGSSVDLEQANNWWVYWSHIRAMFYVYSYASGLLVSKAMQGAVKKDKKFISQVKDFLATGTSDSPVNIFKKMGIDITKKEFWNQGLDEIEMLLNEAESLAKKLGKVA